VLQAERGIGAAPQMHGVVGLFHCLSTVVEPSVAQRESIAARRQILLVVPASLKFQFASAGFVPVNEKNAIAFESTFGILAGLLRPAREYMHGFLERPR
jgi:hypothetical protein